MKNLFWSVVKSKLRGNPSYLAHVICRGKKTLDVGCGFGHFLVHDRDNFYGIDINQEALAFCRDEGFRVAMAGVDRIPFPDDTFDRVIALQVIEHLYADSAYRLLSESCRVLAPGGLLALSTDLATKRFWNTFSHIRPYPPESLSKILTSDPGHRGQETFEKGIPLEILGIYFNGRFFRNSILTALSQLLANLLRVFAGNYTVILKKRGLPPQGH